MDNNKVLYFSQDVKEIVIVVGNHKFRLYENLIKHFMDGTKLIEKVNINSERFYEFANYAISITNEWKDFATIVIPSEAKWSVVIKTYNNGTKRYAGIDYCPNNWEKFCNTFDAFFFNKSVDKNNVSKEESNKLIIRIPSDFQKVNTLPEDPANSTAYVKQTQSSMCFLLIYPINNEISMPYENEKAVIDGIRSTLASDQGLVEVHSGLTNSQKKYIYSIVKSKMESSGMQYILTMHIDMNNSSMNIQANFDEIGMTGVRDSIILTKMINEGKVIPPDMDEWFKDPYDEKYKTGLLMNISEKPEYDVMFPEHPLSEARLLIKFILENN